MAPTYLYIVAILAMIAIGVGRWATGTLPEYVPPAEWLSAAGGSDALTIFLILRAFSSGAAVLTGVEAISDGVPAFKPPEWRNARITLVWAAAIFGTLFLGISFMASTLGVVPDPHEEQTVLSQIARLLVGDGAFFVVIQLATVLVLALAANTAFADFPRLSLFLARDSFMPRQFAFRGERLAFTTGIVALSGLAMVLLVLFDASVSALIPLYTLGVFLAFTLSQSSMVVRWWRRHEEGWRRGLAINRLGAATTGVIALIVVESKFLSGAWMVVIAIPLLVILMRAIHGHYRAVEAGLRGPRRPPIAQVAAPMVIVPIARLDEAARRAIAFANSISASPTGVHVTNDPDAAEQIRREWPEWSGGAELRDHRVAVPGADRPAARVPRRDPATRSHPPGSGGGLRVRAAALVGEPAPQPDRPAAEAAPVHAPERDRRRCPVPPGRAPGAGLGPRPVHVRRSRLATRRPPRRAPRRRALPRCTAR